LLGLRDIRTYVHSYRDSQAAERIAQKEILHIKEKAAGIRMTPAALFHLSIVFMIS
jgi:hypothetical protein